MAAAGAADREQQRHHQRQERQHQQRRQGRSTEQPNDSAASSAWCGLMRSTARSLVPACLFGGRQPPAPPPTRLHHVWPGRNVFFLDGRVIFGPDPRGLIVVAISVLLSERFLLASIVDPSSEYPLVMAAISTILAATVFAILLLTATRDPGITPRNQDPHPPSSEDGPSTVRRTRRLRIVVNGVITKLKYCRACRSFRPPRSSHCAVCDNCVDKFDHHCPWIGQCIGLRNYRYYLLLVITALAFYVYTFALSARRIKGRIDATSAGIFSLMRSLPETFALAAFSFMAVWVLACHFTFNALLVAKNQTRHEMNKGRYRHSPNPYDKGVLNNIKECLFERLPPPRVDFRALAEPFSLPHSDDNA